MTSDPASITAALCVAVGWFMPQIVPGWWGTLASWTLSVLLGMAAGKWGHRG